MAINPITARTGSPHVTSLDARRVVYALGGPSPHRCKEDDNYDTPQNFKVAVNEGNSSYYDILPGTLVYHGYVINNDDVVTTAITPAGSGKYKKALVFIKTEMTDAGIDTASFDIAYSAEGATAASVSYPTGWTIAGDRDPFVFPALETEIDIPLAHVLIHEGVIESIDNLIPEYINKPFYSPGDSINLSYGIYSGYIAASGANVYFFIPFSKPTAGITGASISGAFTIRHADGGFVGSSSGQALSTLGTVDVTPYETGAYVRVVMGTASQLTNQAPLSVLASSGAKLTFS